MVVSAEDCSNITSNENNSSIQQNIYVSPNGDDQWGNGSFESPYSSIRYAIDNSANNSKITLLEGIYNGELNTNLVIDKYLTIESTSNNVIVNGENKNYFFKINEGSSLVLNNIQFINGFTDSFSQLAVINNQGKLVVNNSSFNEMNDIMAIIFNQGELIVDNSQLMNSRSQNMAQSITNIGTCTISNSKLVDIDSNSNSLPSIYNFNKINIINCDIPYFSSNYQYDESNFKNAVILLQNSKFGVVEIENATCTINNSNFNSRTSFKNMDVSIDKSKFAKSSSLLLLSIFDTNLTATHTIFESYISCGRTNFNITYSAILDGMSGSGKTGSLYAPYNWWGINSGPSFSYFKNNTISCWAITTFEAEDNDLSVGTQSKFIASFKWSDGNSTFDLSEDEYLPSRPIYFESQNGVFSPSSGTISTDFSNYLINNYLDCEVYSVVDNQRMTLKIGQGLSAYTYFVAPWGHNGLEDGSLEKPFKSIKYAVEHVGNGNTICLLEGIYKNNANSDITIGKNITIVGLGDVKLVRANGKTMFTIQEWGNLVLKNVDISVDITEYENYIFTVIGGNLTLINSTVHDSKSNTVIYTGSGNQNAAKVWLIDSNFRDIVGSAISGDAVTYVEGSLFERMSNYYHSHGFENYNSVFSLTSSIEVYKSIFKENKMGIINLHPFYYSSSSALGASYSTDYGSVARYAYVDSSLFIDNVFKDMNDYYSSVGVGLNIYDSYGSFNGDINNCTFINNKGKIATVNKVHNSSFINNSGQAYAGNALVEAVLINNSQFSGNLNQYVDGDGAYIGEGIASADTILNSIFINNHASFGGAVSASKTIHYCVFINNTARYAGNDIYSSSGDVDYSSNWWGDNQKPTSEKIFIFLGTLTLNDWIIMTFESRSSSLVKAELNNVIDDDGNIRKLDCNIPSRPVVFRVDGANVTPNETYTVNNSAFADLSYDSNSKDFKVYATIDNQLMDLDIRNSNTCIVMGDIVVKGNNNKFGIDLINVNGYRISNQTLTVEIIDSEVKRQMFTVCTDDSGHGSFDIDYPIGKYDVFVTFGGNGFFDKSNASAKIEVQISSTSISSYDSTYYGKNNIFYAILQDENKKGLVNFTVYFTITDSSGNYRIIAANTDLYGRAELSLSLDVGRYSIKSEYTGDSWYSKSSDTSSITIKPADTTIYLPNATLYGAGNTYDIILKDIYGNLISGEHIIVRISRGNLSDKFILTTDDDGVAQLTINYLPGSYNVEAVYNGDRIYGASSAKSTISVEKVSTLISGFYYKIIPLNGVYTVVLSDMYGHRIYNESIILNCYAGKLVKTYEGVSDANGEASFVIDLDEGTYLVTMDYDGSVWYNDATNAATLVISKEATLESIYINSTDLVQYYGENKYFIIEFNDPNAYSQYGKTIVVTLTSGTWSRAYNVYTDVFGLARLQINLDPGEYDVAYKYSNQYYDIFGSGMNSITVYKMPIVLLANDMIIKYGENRVYEVAVRDVNNNPVKNVEVSIGIGSDEYEVVTNDDGIAKLLLDLNIGLYNISYSVNNPNYISASDSSAILVVDDDKISTKINSNDVGTYDNETINLTCILTDSLNNPISSSEVAVEISTFDGEFVKKITATTNLDGNAIFEVNLEYGQYIAKISYQGNDIYLTSKNVNTIKVLSSDNRTKTVLFKGNVKIDKSQMYYAVLSDVNGLLLKNKEIVFYISNNTYHVKTDDYGRAFLNLNLSVGVHNIKAVFNGDEEYKPVSSLLKLNILSNLTYLNAQKLVKYYRNGTQFHAQLLDEDYYPMANRTVWVVLENNQYNCTTDENGWITLNIDLKPGHYDIECYYIGGSPDENSYDDTTIDVLSTVIGQNEVRYYGQYPYLSIKFIDGAGDAIRNTQFIVGVDGKNYIGKTDGEGIFNFNLNLDSGSHIISVNNPYDGLYANYTLEILPTIQTNSLVKVLGDGKTYQIALLDLNGDVLSNTNVDIVINGIKYIKKTNLEGEINLDMELTPNKYLVTVINPNTQEYVEKTIKVLHPISENKNLVMYFTSGSSFKVRILGEGGNPVGQGKVVKFTINKKQYAVKTDKKGYASLKISLKPNTYKITVNYNGYKVNNKITVKPLLTAKNISKKARKVQFSAKLVNIKGKVASGKKVSFKFKNKKYVAKTNKKGIATIKLTLSPGKYSIFSSYGKSVIKNTILIRK